MRRKFIIGAALAAVSGLGLIGCQGQSEGAPSQADAELAPVSGPAEAYALAAKAHGFSVGQQMAANTVYVFFDPQCPHCGTLWKNAQPLLSRVRMVWVPVSLLSKASTPQGAYLLSVPDAQAKMNEHEASLSARTGGISVPLSGVSAEFKNKIEQNTKIFNALGARSVPYVVYRHTKTGEPSTSAGALPTEALSSLLGLSAVEVRPE